MNKPQDDTSREHGVIDKLSVRTVGMNWDSSRQVIREEEDMRYPMLSTSMLPPVVNVSVTGDIIGQLTNGLGANWAPAHQGEEAYPEENDEEGWRRVIDGMTECGIKWVRYWLQPGFYVDGNFDEQHRYLRRLDRLQEWAERDEATIMLELYTIPTQYRFSDVYDAPRDNQRYVDEYIIPVLKYVVHERGIDRIRLLSLFNEPFNPDVSPVIFAPEPPKHPLEHYLELHEILRKAMDEAGLEAIGLIGPDSANMFQRHIEMYEDMGLAERVSSTFAELDCHLWRTRFDYYPPCKRWPGYTMTEGMNRYLRPTVAAAHRLGKRLSLTEVNSMYFNDHKRTDRITRHDAFLMTAEAIVRSINEGVAGIMVWCYTNSGRADGQWGWVGTQDAAFAPVPHLYNGFGLLMRHQRVGADIRRCEAAPSDYAPYISAAAQRDAQGGQTLWLVNDHPSQQIAVRLEGVACTRGRAYLKNLDADVTELDVAGRPGYPEIVLPGMSLCVITEDAGLDSSS